MNHVLTIGAKNQVTLSKDLLEHLGLGKGSQLMVEMQQDRLVLHPAVSVPRRALPKELRDIFVERRGESPQDVPLDKFLQGVEMVVSEAPVQAVKLPVRRSKVSTSLAHVAAKASVRGV